MAWPHRSPDRIGPASAQTCICCYSTYTRAGCSYRGRAGWALLTRVWAGSAAGCVLSGEGGLMAPVVRTGTACPLNVLHAWHGAWRRRQSIVLQYSSACQVGKCMQCSTACAVPVGVVIHVPCRVCHPPTPVRDRDPGVASAVLLSSPTILGQIQMASSGSKSLECCTCR